MGASNVILPDLNACIESGLATKDSQIYNNKIVILDTTSATSHCYRRKMKKLGTVPVNRGYFVPPKGVVIETDVWLQAEIDAERRLKNEKDLFINKATL